MGWPRAVGCSKVDAATRHSDPYSAIGTINSAHVLRALQRCWVCRNVWTSAKQTVECRGHREASPSYRARRLGGDGCDQIQAHRAGGANPRENLRLEVSDHQAAPGTDGGLGKLAAVAPRPVPHGLTFMVIAHRVGADQASRYRLDLRISPMREQADRAALERRGHRRCRGNEQ